MIGITPAHVMPHDRLAHLFRFSARFLQERVRRAVPRDSDDYMEPAFIAAIAAAIAIL